MKFSYAWSDVSSQNVTLRVFLLSSSICLILVSGIAIRESFKAPLVIERGCATKAAQAGADKRTTEEVQNFVKLALSQRFDTGVRPSPEYISQDEIGFKKQEEQDLTSKNMSQTLIVRAVKVDDAGITVDTDRVISVGQIRSVLPFPLKVILSKETRSEQNPFGLVLTRVSAKKDGNQQ